MGTQLNSGNTQKKLTQRFSQIRSWLTILNTDKKFEASPISRICLSFINYYQAGTIIMKRLTASNIGCVVRTGEAFVQGWANQFRLPPRKMERYKTRFYDGSTILSQTHQEIIYITCRWRLRGRILNHLVLPLKR